MDTRWSTRQLIERRPFAEDLSASRKVSRMTTITPTQFTVIDGPNAADITNCLLYAYSPRPMLVHFKCKIDVPGYARDTTAFDAVITAVKYESGAPGMFLIEFFPIGSSSWTNGNGYYNANRRSGTLEMTAVR